MASIAAIGLLGMPLAASGQERPQPVVELAVGWVGFADDGVVGEGLAGGAARIHLLPRIVGWELHVRVSGLVGVRLGR